MFKIVLRPIYSTHIKFSTFPYNNYLNPAFETELTLYFSLFYTLCGSFEDIFSLTYVHQSKKGYIPY